MDILQNDVEEGHPKDTVELIYKIYSGHKTKSHPSNPRDNSVKSSRMWAEEIED